MELLYFINPVKKSFVNIFVRTTKPPMHTCHICLSYYVFLWHVEPWTHTVARDRWQTTFSSVFPERTWLYFDSVSFKFIPWYSNYNNIYGYAFNNIHFCSFEWTWTISMLWVRAYLIMINNVYAVFGSRTRAFISNVHPSYWFTC